MEKPHVVVVQQEKSVVLAMVLGFFFGPLGLLYSSLVGAIVMFLVCFAVGALTLGFGLFLAWPVCALWGFAGAVGHNRAQRKRLDRQLQRVAADVTVSVVEAEQ